MRVVTTLSLPHSPTQSQPGYPPHPPTHQCQGGQRVDPQIRKKKGKGGGEGLTWVSGESAVGGKTSRTVEGSYLLSLPLLS